MGRKKTLATNAEMRSAANMMLDIAELFKRISRAAELVGAGMEEVGRYRGTVLEADTPLDWKSFLRDAKIFNSDIGHYLSNANCTKFVLGKLSICLNSGLDYASMCVRKKVLEDCLLERFGVKFQISIRNQ